MHKPLLAVALALGVAVAMFAACGTPKTCDSTSCKSGCCDASGTCQLGNSSSACGSAGFACATCSGNTTCSLGVCAANGGGAGGSGGGSTGGGTGGGSTGGGAGGGTGGGSTGGGTGGGSTGGGTGGGSTGGGAGGGTAVTININFSASCPALSPCASSPVGVWHYTAACIDLNNPFPAVSQLCNTATFHNLVGTTRGNVTVTAVTTSRNVTTHVTGSLDVPTSCAAQFGGCANVQTGLSAILTTVSCTGTTSCTCPFTFDANTASTDPSTYSGSTLTVSPTTGNARTYGYCLAAGSLTYKETTATPADIGIYTMQQ